MPSAIPEVPGQLALTCEGCGGTRIIRSDDTPEEVCDECDGTGIDPDALWESCYSAWQEL